MHPLAPDLSNLSDDELHKKYGEIIKRIDQCYRFGPMDMVGQLQLLMGDYQAEIARRNQANLEKIMNDPKIDNSIDIG